MSDNTGHQVRNLTGGKMMTPWVVLVYLDRLQVIGPFLTNQDAYSWVSVQDYEVQGLCVVSQLESPALGVQR